MAGLPHTFEVWVRADAEPLRITWDKGKRLWKKCIGTKLGADGKVRQRLFWLGPDQQIALHRAKVLRRCWWRMNAEKPSHWTPEAEAWAEECIRNERAGAHMLANYARRIMADLSDSHLAPRPAEVSPLPVPVAPPALPAPSVVTVKKLCDDYTKHAETYYRTPDGRESGEVEGIRIALKMLDGVASLPAAEFGPSALKKARSAMIAKKWVRTYINAQVGRIRRMFKWGVENELVPASVLHGLLAVAGLKKGRSEAQESEPVRPVPDAHIEAVRSRVSDQVRAVIDLQLLTGARPGEVLMMRTGDIDRSNKLWVYTPERHKTEHHGAERKVYLGPKAQAVLLPFLNEKRPQRYLFSPADAEAARRKQMHDERETPLSCGNRPGKRSGGLKSKRTRPPGERYDIATYRRAIARACKSAKVASWHPHQLRHNAATRLRKEHGLEAAQVVLGHRTLKVTQVYAERDQAAAAESMAKVG